MGRISNVRTFKENDEVIVCFEGMFHGRATVTKVLKTGNFRTSDHLTMQWRQSGLRAGRTPGRWRVYPACSPEGVAKVKRHEDDQARQRLSHAMHNLARVVNNSSIDAKFADEMFKRIAAIALLFEERGS